ncbi:hypothetical protein Tco_0949856 [Tanacetum coccineum]
MDAVRVCLLIVAELVFMGKEDRNCIPRHLVSLVEDFDKWDDYPWVALVKGDDERIAKLERLVNQIVVNQGKGSSSNDLMSTCSRPDIDNVKVVDDGMLIDNADGNHDIRIGLYNASSCSPANIDNGKVIGAGMGIDNFNGKNDIPNENHNAVNQGLGGYANDPMVCTNIYHIK